jgi:hypothetical protein
MLIKIDNRYCPYTHSLRMDEDDKGVSRRANVSFQPTIDLVLPKSTK